MEGRARLRIREGAALQEKTRRGAGPAGGQAGSSPPSPPPRALTRMVSMMNVSKAYDSMTWMHICRNTLSRGSRPRAMSEYLGSLASATPALPPFASPSLRRAAAVTNTRWFWPPAAGRAPADEACGGGKRGRVEERKEHDPEDTGRRTLHFSPGSHHSVGRAGGEV